MRESVGLAFNSIIRCGTLVACQGHGKTKGCSGGRMYDKHRERLQLMRKYVA